MPDITSKKPLLDEVASIEKDVYLFAGYTTRL